MRIYGDIEDARTEKPLSGALVSLYLGDTCLVENTPATGGKFNYSFEESLLQLDEHILTCHVEKRRYKSQTATKEMTGDDVRFSLELVPILIDWYKIIKIALTALVILVVLAILVLLGYWFFTRPDPKVDAFWPSFSETRSGEIIPYTKDIKNLAAITAAGKKTVLSWELKDAKHEDVYLYNGIENKKLDKKDLKNKSKEVFPEKTTIYTLSFEENPEDLNDENSMKMTVFVPPPPQIVNFDADPLEVDKYGNSLLKWTTVNAEMVYITDREATELEIKIEAVEAMKQWRKAKPKVEEVEQDFTDFIPTGAVSKCVGKKGECRVDLLTEATYWLVAVNIVDEVEVRRVTVNILYPPVIGPFSASPTLINKGDISRLEWQTLDADEVYLNEERLFPNFSKEVAPIETTTYTLVARNKAGEVRKEVTVEVAGTGKDGKGKTPGEEKKPAKTLPAKVNYFHTSPPIIAIGQSCTLGWVVEHAKAVYLNGDLVKPLGTKKVFPQETTSYELRVVDQDGDEYCWPRTVEVKPNTCTIILYELENYRGDYEEFTEDSPDIGGLNNDVSSIRIIGDCSVKVYSGNRYKAIHQVFSKNVPSLRGTLVGNDNVSSIKIIRAKWNNDKN